MSSEMLAFLVCFMLLLLCVNAASLQIAPTQKGPTHWRISKREDATLNPSKRQRKPEWIRKDILHLKAMLPPSAGVRQIAALFNRIQANKTDAKTSQVWRIRETLNKSTKSVLLRY